MAGSSASGVAVTYGSPGIVSPTVDPGGRYGGCSASSHISSTLFYFGGFIGSVYLGDFWQFDMSSAWWTMVHISKVQSNGVMGTPLNTVYPGLKAFHACAITLSNSFYLSFGLSQNGYENNIFAWSFSIGQWTWITGNTALAAGNSVGVGVESSQNMPASRSYHTMNELAFTNCLLTFGGNAPTYAAYMNDLWRYSLSNNLWTLLSGTYSAVNQAAVYNSVGVASASSVPAGIQMQAMDFISNTDKLLMFDGLTNSGYNNEL